MSFVAYGVVVWLFVVGLYGVVTSRNLIHMVVSLSVVAASTDLLLVAIGYRAGASAPVYLGLSPGRVAVDPVMQAFASTDIVIGGAVIALMLAVVVQIHKRTGSLDPEDLRRRPPSDGHGHRWSSTTSRAARSSRGIISNGSPVSGSLQARRRS
jgi:multicomponent Na+:H+ antiporter subunit C